jgi:hypothetical protein
VKTFAVIPLSIVEGGARARKPRRTEIEKDE